MSVAAPPVGIVAAAYLAVRLGWYLGDPLVGAIIALIASLVILSCAATIFDPGERRRSKQIS